MTNKTKRQKGFSLIELLIVVAIILIIAAIAVPRLLSARAAASQSAAAATTKSVGTALSTFNTAWGIFPASATALGGTTCATNPATAAMGCTMDDTQAQAIAAGTPINKYIFTYAQTASGAGFTLNADPAPGSNATRHFYLNEGNTIHYNDSAAAASTDPSLGQ